MTLRRRDGCGGALRCGWTGMRPECLAVVPPVGRRRRGGGGGGGPPEDRWCQEPQTPHGRDLKLPQRGAGLSQSLGRRMCGSELGQGRRAPRVFLLQLF